MGLGRTLRPVDNSFDDGPGHYALHSSWAFVDGGGGNGKERETGARVVDKPAHYALHSSWGFSACITARGPRAGD